MKKNIWVCGLIGGIVAASWGVVGEGVLSDSLSLNTRMVFGYASMILAFSLIFVAVKNYRDNYNSGIITFWKALKIGLLITLIASTVYVIVWMVDYSYFLPNFGEKYQAQVLAELKASGASAAVIQKQATEMAATMEKYRTSPAFRAIFTYLEIVPVGIVISLIAALILKNKSKPTAVNA
jgi:Na+/glutamate symporter